MPWIRVDDHFDEHPKFAKAGPLGIALWLAGLAYCNRNQTDGFIPWTVAMSMLSWEFLGDETNGDGMHKVYQVGVTSGMAGEDVDCAFVAGLLLRAGLWEQADGGYRVHDYPVYQLTKAQIESERARKIAAGQAGGVAAAKARAAAPAQAESKPGPKPNSVPPETTSPPQSPAGGRGAAIPKPKKERVLITDQDTEELVDKYAEQFGTALAVREVIEDALNHVNRFKALSERRYVDKWLRTELERKQIRPFANGRVANSATPRLIDRTGIQN